MTFRFAIKRHASGQLTGTRLFEISDNANAERGERRRSLPKIRFPKFSAWECHCIRRKSCLAVGPTHQTPDMERYWYWAYVAYVSINLNPTSQVTLTAVWCLEAWWFGSAQLVSRELLLQWKNNRGFSNSSSADGLDVGAKDINMQHIYICMIEVSVQIIGDFFPQDFLSCSCWSPKTPQTSVISKLCFQVFSIRALVWADFQIASFLFGFAQNAMAHGAREHLASQNGNLWPHASTCKCLENTYRFILDLFKFFTSIWFDVKPKKIKRNC